MSKQQRGIFPQDATIHCRNRSPLSLVWKGLNIDDNIDLYFTYLPWAEWLNSNLLTSRSKFLIRHWQSKSHSFASNLWSQNYNETLFHHWHRILVFSLASELSIPGNKSHNVVDALQRHKDGSMRPPYPDPFSRNWLVLQKRPINSSPCKTALPYCRQSSAASAYSMLEQRQLQSAFLLLFRRVLIARSVWYMDKKKMMTRQQLDVSSLTFYLRRMRGGTFVYYRGTHLQIATSANIYWKLLAISINRANRIKEFQSIVTILLWKKVLWLDVASYMALIFYAIFDQLNR